MLAHTIDFICLQLVYLGVVEYIHWYVTEFGSLSLECGGLSLASTFILDVLCKIGLLSDFLISLFLLDLLFIEIFRT